MTIGGLRNGRRGRPLPFPALAADQAVYSASNFALAALAGRTLDRADFGRFALLALASAVAVALVRAVWLEPDLARRPGPRTVGPRYWTAVASVALVATVSGFGLWWVDGSAAVIGGLAAVVTLAQDRARYRALAGDRFRRLLIGDVAWLAVAVAAVAGLGRSATPATVMTVWLAGAAAGLLPHLSPVRSGSQRLPRPDRGPGVDCDHPESGRPGRRRALLVDFLLATGSTQLGGLALGALLPLDQFAALRGAIVAYGPVGIAVAALSTWVFASGTGLGPGPVGRRAAAVALLSLGLTVVAVATPATVGRAILGSAWPSPAVLALIGLSVTGQAVSGPGFALLRLADDRRRLLALRAGGLVVFLGLTLGAAVRHGDAAWVAAGYATANAVVAAAVWLGPAPRVGVEVGVGVGVGVGDQADPAHGGGEPDGGQPGPGHDRGHVPSER